MDTMTPQEATMYEAQQIDGRPETDPINRMWSVIDTRTHEVVASWRETPNIGMTEQDAFELAFAWNALAPAIPA